MVTMKIKSRIKDSGGQNYVGVELNLNIQFLAANAMASRNVLILDHRYPFPCKKSCLGMEGCFRYKGQNFGENLHHVGLCAL